MKLSECKRLLDEGWSCLQIGKKAGVSAQDVRDAFGIDADMVEQLYNEGMDKTQIIFKTGSSEHWVRTQMSKRGLENRDRRRRENRKKECV